MLKLYFESEAIKISYDEDLQFGTAEWTGFLSSNELRSYSLRCVELINEKGLTRWLANSTKMKAIRQQDQEWTLAVLLPKMLDSPLRRMANLVSEDIFNKMAFEHMLKRTGPLGEFIIREFDSKPEAMAWLKRPFGAEAIPASGTSSGGAVEKANV